MNHKTSWYRPCPVCGQDNTHVCFENRLAVLDELDMSYAVTSCNQCDFDYAAYLPPPERYDLYYQSLSKYDVTLESSAIPEVDRMRAEAAVKFVTPLINKSDSVLDLGCGSGTLLNAFNKAGWSRIYGVDPAPNAQEQARVTFNLDGVQTGRLSEASEIIQLCEINLICMMGVLEHLPRLAEDLEHLFKQCHDQVNVLIEVPASERFMADDFEPFGEFSIEHIQFFSMLSLNKLMAGFGFYPVKTSYLDLPPGTTDSLLCLYSRRNGAGETVVSSQENSDLMQYIDESAQRLEHALTKIQHSKLDSLVIYGAGSHTVRLIPHLISKGLFSNVIGIVDNNPNLQGKSLSGLEIQKPMDIISRNPQATILVSSYRSQQPIADSLSKQCSNPILTIY